MKKTIYLIRHAEPESRFGEDICMGRNTDLPLSENGKAAARELAAKLEDEVREAGTVYSSPLKRARFTAFELCVYAGVPMKIISSLTEMDAGKWDGKTMSRIQEEYSDLLEKCGKENVMVPPGGEEFADAAERAHASVSTIAKISAGEKVVIVTHAFLIRSLLCKLTGTPFEKMMCFPQDWLTVSKLVYDTETDALCVAETDGDPSKKE